MTIGFFVVVIVLCIINSSATTSFRTLIFLLLYGALLLAVVRNVIKPFTQLLLAQFSYVPYSELIVLCAICIYGVKVVTALLEQLELESIVPLAEIAMRFTLFVYCFEELKPTLTSLSSILSGWT